MKPTICKLPVLVFVTLLANACANQTLGQKNEIELVSHITQILTDPLVGANHAPCPSTNLRAVGVRRLYSNLSVQLSYVSTKKMIGAPIFITGPHQDGQFDLAYR